MLSMWNKNTEGKESKQFKQITSLRQSDKASVPELQREGRMEGVIRVFPQPHKSVDNCQTQKAM